MPISRVYILGRLVLKYTTKYEAIWTRFLAPDIYVGFRGGWLIQKRVRGKRFDQLTLSEKSSLLPVVAYKLGEIHRRSISVSAPKLRPFEGWYTSLLKLWGTSPYKISSIEWKVLEQAHILYEALENIDLSGVFKDANPRNWIVDQNVVRAIDFGSMSLASFASDLSQLLDYDKLFVESDFVCTIEAWSSGFGSKDLAKNICSEFPIISIYSALCRAPFHTPDKRVTWYLRAAERTKHIGWPCLAAVLEEAAESILILI